MPKTQASNSPGTPATVRSLRRNKGAFYKSVWPALEQEGWSKIDASESMSGKPIFIPKVKAMQLKEGQKGEDFYDEEEAVIARLLQRRNTTESTILDDYLAEVGTNASSEAVREKPEAQLEHLDLDAEGSSDQETATEAEHGPSDSEHPEDQLDEMERPAQMLQSEHDRPIGSDLGSPADTVEAGSGLEGKDEQGKTSTSEGAQSTQCGSDGSIEDMGNSGLQGLDARAKMSASESDEPAQSDAVGSIENMEVDTELEGMDEPEKLSAAEADGLTQGIPGQSIDGAGNSHLRVDEPTKSVASEGDQPTRGNAAGSIEDVDDSGLEGMDEPRKMSASERDQPVRDNSGTPCENMEVDSGREGIEEPGKMSASEGDQSAQGNSGRSITGIGDSGLNGMEEAGMVATEDQGCSTLETDADSERKSKEGPVDGADLATQKDDNKLVDANEQIVGTHQDEKASTKAAEESGRERKRQRTSGWTAEKLSEAVDGSANEPQDDSFDTTGTNIVTSAKKERPKRSSNKSKSAKTALEFGTKGMGYDESKGKGTNDLSDQDGSVYHSSDESHQERKRKRRAVSAPQSGGKSRGGRSRGRARRKPRRAPSPKRSVGTSPKPRGGRKAKEASTALLDLSWKNGGKNFPTKESRVGAQYNATSIEPAGTWKKDESYIYCQQIWDPEMAEQKIQGESTDFLATRLVPHNKREAAMIGLAEVGYDAEKFDEQKIVDNVITKDGTEWTEEERKRYHLEIFRFRKNIREVSRVTGKSMNSCFAYYLGTFKKSDDYRLLKSVCYQERLRRLMDSEHDLDACAICGDGGNLLICDGCECEYHMECCRPALKIIPEGRWECDECVDRKFVTAKDSLIRNSSLFERLQQQRSGVGNEDGGGEPSSKEPKNTAAEGSGSLRVRPTPQALDIFSKLAQNINAAFSEE